MPKFTEDQLNNFRYPPSDTEEEKLSNSERQVKEAVNNWPALKTRSITIFGQGSYANDTNVRVNSDIDINVMLTNTVFYELPSGKNYEDYGYSPSDYRYTTYRNDVFNALVYHFGSEYVRNNNKCITVLPNTTRVEIDVVPTLRFDRYDGESRTPVEGVRFIANDGTLVTNFPIQHIENGRFKNSQTQKRFKRLTRIFRRIRYKMLDDRYEVNQNITSFLLECLLWNVPNYVYNNNHTWTERLKEAIVYIYDATSEGNETCKDWGEVSELLYLFRGRKWSIKDVNQFMLQMWRYLEF
jgi:hypothetical protein